MESAATVVGLMQQIERLPGAFTAVESGTRRVSVADLRTLSSRLANAFVGLGLGAGARVAYAASNHLEYVVLEFALLKAGLAKVPLNHRLTATEMWRCLELADVRLVVADEATASALDDVRSPQEEGPARVVIGHRPGWVAFDALTDHGSATSPAVPVAPEDVYHIRFSSGSTGTPKGIAISHRGARAAILGNTWAMCASSPALRPRTLHVAPLVYAGGWSVLPTLLRGGTNVVLPRFDADETLEAVRDLGIDWMFAVPTMLRRMSESVRLGALRESRLSCLMLAGEPAAIPALEVVSEYTDALAQSWGQTEAPASTTLVSREEMRNPQLWPSIGRPVPGVEFSLLVADQVAPYPEPGVLGELVVRTVSRAIGLLGAQDEFERRQLPDGWWRTSDIASFDDEGRIFILGRASETIITGGTNIQPVEIERALEAHPHVIEAVVVGVPDTMWGETPAALVHAPDLTPGDGPDLLEWLRARLAGFKRPRHVFLTAQPLPRASGEAKLARGEAKRTIAGWVVAPGTRPDHVKVITSHE